MIVEENYIKLKYPSHLEFNKKIRPVLVNWSETLGDFRLKQKDALNNSEWADRHQYFPLESSWHSEDDLYVDEMFQPFCQFILGLTTGIFNQEFKFSSMWAKVARKNSYGKRHSHRGAISGVYYVDNGIIIKTMR